MYSSLLASSTLVVWKALEIYDIDAASLFRKAGLNPDDATNPQARYPYSAVRRLWELSIEESDDPCFVLIAARQWHPSNFHALGYAWLASRSLKEALERLIRYFRVVTSDPEELTLVAHKDSYEFVIDTSTVVYRALDVEYDLMLSLILDACRLSLGEDYRPRRVCLQRPRPSCEDRYSRFFGTRVEFDAPFYSMVFDKSQLDQLLPTGNAEIAMANDQILMSYLTHLNRSDIVMRVKTTLIERMPSGQVPQEDVADALSMSLRTLQRKLNEEGTSFKQLLDETRRELADQYIRNPMVSIGEITYLLGFSEPGNFSRAFKRWNGAAPTEYRRIEV